MGTIVERRRKDGTPSFLAKISITRDGEIVHRENKTFDRKPAASAWLTRREDELKIPGAIEAEKQGQALLRDVIDKYTTETLKTPGRTKSQAIRTLKEQEIAGMKCGEIKANHYVALATALLKGGRKPQTVKVYMSHLTSIVKVARPAWGFPLSKQELDDALVSCRMLGLIDKADERDRRPTLDELDKLMTYFKTRHDRSKWALPMHKIIAFAIFGIRRQEEITLLRWEDLDIPRSRILVRHMKDPRRKANNNIWCELTPEAMAIIKAMLRRDEFIFPYHPGVISRTFTNACQELGIEDLHFHDLRHDGVSRLFEMGRTIPQVAAVSAHKSWTNLQRYTHLAQAGDKYAGWSWFEAVNERMTIPVGMRPLGLRYGGSEESEDQPQPQPAQ